MNLFWKIFMTFGIAMTVTLVVAVFVSFRLVSQAFDQLNIENREEIIQRAATALEQGGVPGLQAWLEENPRPVPGVMLMVVDEGGRELLGRELPRRFSRLLNSRPGVRRRGPPNLRPIQMTPNLVAANGEEYRLLFVRTRITVLGVLTWPATQLAVLVLVVLAALATALPLARYLSSPIVRLQRASRALAAGALGTRVGKPFTRRKDEAGILARDFDAMAEQIQALVTGKETLLRDVSHEFRSPLARIRVALALAQRKSSEASQADLARIEQETERLDELVAQVMTLARLRTQSVTRRERISPDELVAEVVENARFEHPDIEIRYEAAAVSEISGNRAELVSAIENVIRNALDHAGKDNVVSVRLRATEQGVEIRVADRGPGVPEPELGRIFEPFYRADESRDHERSGQGIGLAITASVIDRHGGRVTARNQPEGGLEVILELPVGQPDAT